MARRSKRRHSVQGAAQAPGRSSSHARPRPRRVKRWKSSQIAVAGGLAVIAFAFLVLLVRSAQHSPPSVQPPADFTLVAYQGQDLLGGDRVQFSHVLGEGKPVVLNFFAGACAPCRGEMPAFQKVADEYQGRVIIVGVDVGPFTGLGTHDDAARLLKDLGIRYPAGYAVDETPLTLYVQGMPTTIVFDARGQVVTRVTGTITEAELQEALRKALAG